MLQTTRNPYDWLIGIVEVRFVVETLNLGRIRTMNGCRITVEVDTESLLQD